MRAYVMPYRVLFHDTMAYGTQHFMTNMKFQCIVREHLFFKQMVDGHTGGPALHADHLILTREAYTSNLGPVGVGERVAILLTVEAVTTTSVRSCFRVIHASGRPIAAGYQTMVAVSRETGRPVELPDWLREMHTDFPEPLVSPDLAARLHGARSADLFDPLTLQLAAEVLAQTSFPVDGAVREVRAPVVYPEGVAFLFPGQGSYRQGPLRHALEQGGEGAERIYRADAVVRRELGVALLPLILAAEGTEHDRILLSQPDVAQIAILLTGLIGVEQLRAAGTEPAVLVGHSLGEITALAAAGAWTLEQAVTVVCQRVLALRTLGPGIGGMLALLGPTDRSQALLARQAVPWAVLNHADQLVVSGGFEELEAVEQAATAAGIDTRRLLSPYPFHSALLGDAVELFAAQIPPVRALRVPVYSPTLGRVLDGRDLTEIADRVAGQLTAPLDFSAAVVALGEAGVTDFVELGGGAALTSFVRRNLGAAVVARSPMMKARAPSPEPIAIVGMGCVLPGAPDPTSLWQALLAGVSAVTVSEDATGRDFLVEGGAVDKTYTLLGGHVLDPPETGHAWLAERFLSEALRQSLEATTVGARVLVALGCTADGVRERDAQLVADALREGAGPELGPGVERTAYQAYRGVAEQALGPDFELIAVDAACASSLYTLDLAVRALGSGRVDTAIAGGVFAPGPANSCLFSQFRGLSATGSRPLDAAADGVVFGEGAALLVLKRLGDAEAAGDTVLAVIRGSGTSSDGRGPSVAVPQAAGQELAIRRAWRAAGEPAVLAEVVEAHATSTPVGDAVELEAIRAAFGPGRRAVGSLKGLTGHTGWTAGAASVIKMVLALQHGRLPAQAPCETPRPLPDGVFVPTQEVPWPGTRGLAGVNAFGFGGSNAHVVLQAADRAPSGQPSATPHRPTERVIVGIQVVRPQDGQRFCADELTLPPGRPVLPDVLDDLDRAHRLALIAAHGALPPDWEEVRDGIAVVVGLSGKLERSVQLNTRLYADHLRRRLAETLDAESIEALLAPAQAVRPSGPYSLPGLMPNVAAGRICSHFDLKGANLVVDTDCDSLGSALRVADIYLDDPDVPLVLVGGIGGAAHQGCRELALVLAVTTPEVAAKQGWPVQARLSIGSGGVAPEREDLRGCSGGPELVAALDHAGQGRATIVQWTGTTLSVVPAEGVRPPILRTTPVLVPTSSVEAGSLPTPVLWLGEGEHAVARVEDLPPLSGFAAVVAVRTCDDVNPKHAPLAELLFEVARREADRVADGTLLLGGICLEGVAPDGRLHPQTGAIAGLFKALQRESPASRCRLVVTDGALEHASGQLAGAWAQDSVEIVVKDGLCHTRELIELAELSAPGVTQSVAPACVWATGGARGVTAQLLIAWADEAPFEAVLIGRSRPAALPEAVRGMDDEAFAAYETVFYRQSRDEAPLATLRRRYLELGGQREAACLIAALEERGCTVQYVVADLLDPEDVAAGLASAPDPDWVVHGAGIQLSGTLKSKALTDFERVVATKLGGLGAVLDVASGRGLEPAVHVLSSAFSFLGNDGQHGYGAANETLARLGAWRQGWSSIAWPGWASVGMTQGSEYAAVARARRLRPLEIDEGQRLFVELVRGQPAAGEVVLLSSRELAWSGVTCHPLRLPIGDRGPDGHPHAMHHVVAGVPTLAGTFGLELTVRAVLSAFPRWRLSAAEQLSWERFVRLSDPSAPLSVLCRSVSEDARTRVVHAQLVSDVRHADGTVLEADRVHFQVQLRLEREVPALGPVPDALVGHSTAMPDPYVQPDAPVALSGPFDGVRSIQLREQGQTASFSLDAAHLGSMAHFAVPALVMDAVCRVALSRPDDLERLPIHVPRGCARFTVLDGLNDHQIVSRGPVTLHAVRPSALADLRTCSMAWATDSAGRVLMIAEGLTAVARGFVANPQTPGSS